MRYSKIKLLFVLIFVSHTAFGQVKVDKSYEPSSENPFGLPNPKVAEELKAFQPLIGSCDCRSLVRNADQSWGDTTNIVWEFKYIMNGTSIQDVTWKDDDTYTSSIRQYNADSSAWYVTFFSSGPGNPSPSTWEGGLNEDKDIILYNEQPAPNGMEGFYKISFKDISEKGFNWRGEWVNKAETFSYPTWLIWCNKTRN